MAILVMEGFEGYDNYLAVRQRWATGANITSSSFITGRDGSGRAMTLNFSSAVIFLDFSGTTTANVVAGFGFKTVTGNTNADVFKCFAEDAVTEQIVLRKTLAGEFAVDRGSTQLGITTDVRLIGEMWYYVELDITFGDGTAGSIDLYVNGENVLSLSSIDTRNVTGDNCGRVGLYGASTYNNGFDDVYFLDDSGTDQTTRIGPCVIETVNPDANGTTNNFTASPAVSNYLNVDDGNAPDDDTTYNHSSTVTHKDLYGHGALTGSISTIYAVLPRSHVRTEAAGARGVKNVARSSATEVDGTEHFIDGTYHYIDHIYENDPNGGGAWTESSVNAAEFGIKITT